MNNRGYPPPPPTSPFSSNLSGPWSAYAPGSHSTYTTSPPPPRFPYSVAGLRSSPGYSPGGVYRGPAGFERHATSPPRVFRTHENEFMSPERYSRQPATTAAPLRRRFTDDDILSDNDAVVLNAGFSFRMGKDSSVVHKHIDVEPAHAIPETSSSGLTRQIDKFLKKSDHTLDRYHNVIQSRSGGRISGQRGKSMTPGGGGREESPEPSTLGLSLRSQRSTSAASIAVKAEKHLESLNRIKNGGGRGGGSKRAAAPIAEHEEDQLDDLSSSDSSLDGFDTDDDVPRSADVFDISDDTSADLSKLSAIEVDPTTNCSTPFDPSRLDDLSSDSDDEYFDVVPLPGLRPQLPPTQLSTSPLPEQQPKPSQQNVLQEPPRVPPTHSQSLPSVNKSIAQSRMGNVQAQPSDASTDPKQPAAPGTESAASHDTKTTADLANAINRLAPPLSSVSKDVHNAVKEISVHEKERISKAGYTSNAKYNPKSENKPGHQSDVKVENAQITESKPSNDKGDNKAVSATETGKSVQTDRKLKDTSQPNIKSTEIADPSSEIKSQCVIGKPNKVTEKSCEENPPGSNKVPKTESKSVSENRHAEEKASEMTILPNSDCTSELKNKSKADDILKLETSQKTNGTSVSKEESKSEEKNSEDLARSETTAKALDVANSETGSISTVKPRSKDKLKTDTRSEVISKCDGEIKVGNTPGAAAENVAKDLTNSEIHGVVALEKPILSSKLNNEACKQASISQTKVSCEQPAVTVGHLQSKEGLSAQNDPLQLAATVSITSNHEDRPVKLTDASLSGAKPKLISQKRSVSAKSNQPSEGTGVVLEKTDGIQSDVKFEKTDILKADTKVGKENTVEPDKKPAKLEPVRSAAKHEGEGNDSTIPPEGGEPSTAETPTSSSTKNSLSPVPESKLSVEDHALVSKSSAISEAAASRDLSLNKQTIDTIKSTVIEEKTNEKTTTPDATKQTVQPNIANRKVRAGSPVPDKSAVMGIKISAPVVTGKLQITPSSGPGPPESKESLDGKIEDSSLAASKNTAPKQMPGTETKITQETSGLAIEKEKAAFNSSEKKSSVDEKPSLEKITKTSNSNEAKSVPVANGIPNNLRVVNGPKANTQASPQPAKSVQITEKSDKIPETNKFGNSSAINDEDNCNDDISEIETFVDMSSRRSSVASDTSRTVSPDVSLRTGVKRVKSEKLAAMMNRWENDDVSHISEKSKPKASATPKVGKISGLKNMFEAGKAGEKADPMNNPNLAKLKSQSGSAIADPKVTPPKKSVPGPTGIASLNAAKFGGTSKFKKPAEVSPKQGENVLKREKSSLSNKDTKAVVAKKENEASKDNQNNIVNARGDMENPENVVAKEQEQKVNLTVESDSGIKDESNKEKQSQKPVAAQAENEQDSVPNGKTVASENSHSGGGDGKEIKKKKRKKKEKTEDTAGDALKNTTSDNMTNSKDEVLGEESKIKHDSDIKKEAASSESKDNLQVTTSEKSDNAVASQTGSEIANSLNGVKQSPAVVESSKMQIDVNKKEENIKSNADTKVNLSEENVLSDAEKIKNNGLSNNIDTKVNISPENVKSEIDKAKSNGPSPNVDVSKYLDEKVEVNGSENKVRGSKKLGGIKSFIESVAKGGKTLEDKLSKTGLHVGKKSTKLDGQKNSPTLESKTKKIIGQSTTPDTTAPDQGSVIKKSTAIKSAEDLGETTAERKQTLAKAIPALESEVESLIKEASGLIKPEETNQPTSSLPSKLTLPTKEILSVASFPDPPLEGEFKVTSLPPSPTKDNDFLTGVQQKTVTSLPSSPTREVHFQFDENQKTLNSDECEDEVFVDAIDPAQLDTLMPLPDVQSERDRRSRSRTPMDIRERSVTPSPIVAQTEALLSETDRILRRSRSNKSLRRSYSRSLSNAALNKLSEVTADLSEEHTTAHLAGERLEAEQAERMKLEKEIDRLQTDVKRMTTENGKLEMEKLALRSEVLSAAELNGDLDDDEAADASLYKRKYEWCLREMELLKKQLKQQQEDDLDQLLLLKKQLEKKVADAYEETDEQRQVVAQLKRKCQRLQAEMNDLKILLEEQTSRNNLLEKKQRKFDQEVMSVQEELRHERANKDKIQRERDQILSEKYSFEQEVTTLKLELELKEEKVSALNRELDDLTSSGKVEEEVATLKKAKHDLELRIKDQEEELDDLAGQVQMLEGAKVRLEMSMEQMRKENRREVSQREEELEEVRISAQKKIKSLEAQLENEHEERTLLVREKHELERRIADLQDRTITHVDEDYVHKLKKELKKTKALLRDTQTMLEKAQSEGSHKLLLRQLKTQLEDAEFAKTAAIKARQCAEADLSDTSSQLDEVFRAKKEAEDKCARISKEKAEIQTQLEESEEEVAEVMKKYKAVVSQLSVDQITLSEQSQQIAELEHSKQVLQERMLELSSKVEVLEGETANIHTQRRLEMKIKEMDSKLELELTTRQRLESQIGRLKDQIERLSAECDAARVKEAQALDQSKRLGRQLRDAKEDLSNIQQRHTEASNKKSELEKQLELADAEVVTLKSDLKLAFKRIEDLQQAIQGDISDSDSDLSDSDSDSDGSLSSYLTASLRHQRSSSNSTLRTPPSEVQQLERIELPNSPCSEAMSAISEDVDDVSTKESFA